MCDDLGRPLETLSVEYIEAGELLLRLGERSVGDCWKAVPYSYRPASRGVGERESFTDELSGLVELLQVRVCLARQLVAFAG